MKKSITKAEIIEALETEPLITNKFFQRSIAGYVQSFPENCPVCAVGAVLRKMSFEKAAREAGINLNHLGSTVAPFPLGTPTLSIAYKDYMSALSSFYERESHKLGFPAREATIAFVKEYFPEEIMIEIDLDKLYRESYENHINS